MVGVQGLPVWTAAGSEARRQVKGPAGPSGASGGTLTPVALSRLWEGVFVPTNGLREGGAGAPGGSGIGGAAVFPPPPPGMSGVVVA